MCDIVVVDGEEKDEVLGGVQGAVVGIAWNCVVVVYDIVVQLSEGGSSMSLTGWRNSEVSALDSSVYEASFNHHRQYLE